MPDLKIELIEPTDKDHEKLLLDYHIDIAFSRDCVKNATLHTKKLYSEPLCLVTSKNQAINKDNFTHLKI